MDDRVLQGLIGVAALAVPGVLILRGQDWAANTAEKGWERICDLGDHGDADSDDEILQHELSSWHYHERQRTNYPQSGCEAQGSESGPEEGHQTRVHDLETQSSLEYRRLDSMVQQIRLITIEPRHAYDDAIRCSLCTIALKSAGSYTALSYCWGKIDEVRHIYVNRKRVAVTPNLNDALKRLRSRGDLVVWVDLLCINQPDQQEKRQQVLQMRQIYNMADKVVAWLGTDDSAVKKVMATLNQLYEQGPVAELKARNIDGDNLLIKLAYIWVTQRSNYPSWMLPAYRRSFYDGNRLSQNLGRLYSKLYRQLEKDDQLLRDKQLDFLDRLDEIVRFEYWERAWILQETTVASSLEVLCGRSRLDFNLFANLLVDMSDLNQRNLIQGFSRYHENIIKLNGLRQDWLNDKPIYLLRALKDGALRRATLKKDKIYSLLSLCHDTERFVAKIDYGSDLSEEMRDMVVYFIQNRKTLDLIALRNPKKKPILRLPSWVPDFRFVGVEQFNHRMINYLTRKDDHPNKGTNTHFWQASADSYWNKAPLLCGDNILQVRGCSPGRIIALCSAAGYKDPEEMSVEAFRSATTINPQRKNDSLARIQTAGTRIYQTLMLYKERQPESDCLRDLGALYVYSFQKNLQKEKPEIYDCLQSLRTFEIGGIPFPAWSLEESDGLRPFHNNERRNKDKAITNAVTRALEDQLRLVETTLGAIGWAHPNSRCGDEIVLLEGCTVPIVLHRSEYDYMGWSTYIVRGDAFIPGAMLGECWSGRSKDLDNIYLR